MKPVINDYDNLTDEDCRLLEIIGWQGKIVKHFKGDYYLIVNVHVQHTETDERMIEYKALYGDCQSYARPASMFMEKCTEEEFKEYGQEYRFQLVNIESKKDKHSDISMYEIRMKQYQNLRECFYKNLVDPILGEDYYNMAMDVYTCDKFTTEDLKSKYDHLKSNINIYKTISIVLFFTIILLLIFYRGF